MNENANVIIKSSNYSGRRTEAARVKGTLLPQVQRSWRSRLNTEFGELWEVMIFARAVKLNKVYR